MFKNINHTQVEKMSIKKNIIKDALVDAREIEKFAFETAKKAIEESMAPQIEQAIINSIKEMESESDSDAQDEAPVVKEGIKLDIAPDADLTINISADGATVEVGGDTISNDNSNPEPEMPEMNTTPESHEDEIFEIAMSEDDAAVAAPEAPADTIAEPEANLNTLNDKLEDLTSKIDSILSAVNPAGEGGEGEVQIVDDEEGAPAVDAVPGMPAAAPAPAPIPQDNTVVNEDDIMFEIEEDVMEGLFETDFMTEDSLDEINLEELEAIEEIEIVDEEDVAEGETVEEMRGMSHTVQRSAGNRKNFEKNNEKHAPIAVNESADNIKAQYESKIDELIKENEGLKETVNKVKNENIEYKDAFVELRKQVNDMQVFNGKLAYANQLLNRAGITAEEKMRIAEAFDKAETVEEAKKLYNNLLSEMKATVTSSPENKLKTAKPQVIQAKESAPKTEALYESEERKKMLRLAGILKENRNS